MDHAHSHAAGTAIDPVCGMTVKTADARNKAQHDGHTYYFCSTRCLDKFTAEPLRYLTPAAAAPAASPAAKPGTIYTCPMHQQIRQVGPGSCPICGMALEPAEASLEERPNEELLDMKRRLWLGALLAVPVMAVDMGGHLFGIDALLPHGIKDWVLLVLATPVVLWAGWPFFVRGVQSVANRSLNMFTLIALGTGVAWLYSVVATVAPGLFPAALRGADGMMPVYFEPAVDHRRAGAGRPGARAQRPRRHRRRHQGAARAGAAHGDAAGRRRHGFRSGDRPDRGRRSRSAYGRARRCRSTAR